MSFLKSVLEYDLHEINSEESFLKSLSYAKSEKLESTHKFTKVNIWGTKGLAIHIIDFCNRYGIEINSIFDSNIDNLGKVFHGRQIESPRQNESPTIVCSYWTSRHIDLAQKSIGENIFTPWEFMISLNDETIWPWWNLRLPNNLSEDEIKYLRKTSERCIDNLSYTEFWKQVAARHMIGIIDSKNVGSDAPSTEYFVKRYTETKSSSIFLDLGAYDGDTINRFFAQEITGGDNRKAVGIEADLRNYLKLRALSEVNPKITPIHAAISDENMLISFNENEHSLVNSGLSKVGKYIVPTVTINQLFKADSFTQVKFDIEGFERIALEGGSSAIKSKNAIWSVASYHLYDDFWILPRKFPRKYKIGVTSHAPRPWDTTFYFLKESSKT
jgi:FkbM family methyltransferase